MLVERFALPATKPHYKQLIMTDPLTQKTTLSRRFAPFLLYVLAFHSLWVSWAYGVYPWMQTLGDTTLKYALLNISLRLLIWVVPVFAYLHWIDHVDPLTYLKLKHNWQRGLHFAIAFTTINFLLTLARFGVPHPILHSLTWNDILSTSLLIGFIEEIPYRGFMLQKLQERLPFWVANLLTSLLFIGIHMPGWIALHLLQIDTVIVVFLFSVLMGVVFKYSKSLWSVIVAHSLNDLLAGVIFRQ
jgi:uncharacterized protein